MGPLAIAEGSSPTTSERRRARVLAGAARLARPPPLRTETCLRTVFISEMSAPLLRSACVSSFRSASSMGGAGSASSAEAPPEMRARSRSPSPSDSASSWDLRAASTPLSSGSGWEAKTTSSVSDAASLPCLGDDQTAREAVPEELLRGDGHRPGGLAGREHEDPTRLETRVPGDDGAVVDPHGAQDGLPRVGRRDRRRKYLSEVLLHRGLYYSSERPTFRVSPEATRPTSSRPLEIRPTTVTGLAARGLSSVLAGVGPKNRHKASPWGP